MKFIQQHLIAFSIIFIASVFGFLSLNKFGISWDEKTQRNTGRVSYEYIFKGSNELLTYTDKDYGVGFALPLYAFEKLLNIESESTVFIVRHGVTHFLFICSSFFIYLLCLGLFKHKWIGWTTQLFYLFMPVIWAHSFFNPKDIPFMALFAVNLYFLFRTQQVPSKRMYLLFGFFLGYLINFRMMGIILIPLFLLLNSVSFFSIPNKKPITYRLFLVKHALFLMAFIIGVLFLWPYLWENPIENFVQAFKNMSRFRWDGIILMLGKNEVASNLPWYYIFVWVGVTSPLGYLFLFIASLLFLPIRLMKNAKNFLTDKTIQMVVLNLTVIIGSVFAVIFLKSVLYDGWRQMFFIFPSMVVLIGYAIYELSHINYTWIKKATWLMIGVVLASVIHAHILTYPHQQVYFNPMVDRGNQHIRSNFVMDYWGVTYFDGLKKLALEDKRDSIVLAHNDGPVEVNLLLLCENDRKRIFLTKDFKNADYYMSFNRPIPPEIQQELGENNIWGINALGSSMMSIWKLK